VPLMAVAGVAVERVVVVALAGAVAAVVGLAARGTSGPS
jgi:hypothetical protein